MKSKHLISLTVFVAFCAMSVTGILMWVKLKPHFVEITHTVVGLLFTGFAVFHIINNWSSIMGYSKDRQGGGLKKELIYAGLIGGLVVIGGLTEVLEPVAEVGKIFQGGEKKKPERVMFEEVQTNAELAGNKLSLIIQKNKEAHEAPIAIWVEDSSHNFVQNLLVVNDNLGGWKAKAKEAKPNFDKEAPHDSFILNTNTTAKAPFYVVTEIAKGGVSEMYEAKVSALGAISAFTIGNKKLIKRGIVEM
jgi:Domain of unknown function (DUF4405)